MPADVDLESELEICLAAAGTAVGIDPPREPVGTASDAPDRDLDDVDWTLVRDVARRHGLLPQLDAYLAERSLEVPQAVRTSIEDAALTVARRNLKLVRIMHGLLEDFDGAGVPALPVKGPVVAELAYGDPGGRPFSDLDLLILPDDVAAADEVLRDAGFALETELGPYDVDDAPHGRRGLPFPEELRYVRADDFVVEARFADGDRRGSANLDVEALWAARSSARIGGQPCPVLAPDDRLAILSYHGSKHAWRRIEWVAGLAGAAAWTDATWHGALESARDRDVIRELHLGALLVDDLLGGDVPADVLRAARADDRVTESARAVRARLETDPLARPAGFEVQRFRGRVRGDAARRVVSSLTMPSVFDYELLPLPEPLWPAYRAVRPVRAALDALRRSG